MTSKKRRLARGIGTVLAAAAASATLAASAASASSDATPPTRITVPGDATGAPSVLIASLEGRNEVTGGAPAGQALELIGLQGSTLSYSVTWRGIGTPTEADIRAGVPGARVGQQRIRASGDAATGGRPRAEGPGRTCYRVDGWITPGPLRMIKRPQASARPHPGAMPHRDRAAAHP